MVPGSWESSVVYRTFVKKKKQRYFDILINIMYTWAFVNASAGKKARVELEKFLFRGYVEAPVF